VLTINEVGRFWHDTMHSGRMFCTNITRCTLAKKVGQRKVVSCCMKGDSTGQSLYLVVKRHTRLTFPSSYAACSAADRGGGNRGSLPQAPRVRGPPNCAELIQIRILLAVSDQKVLCMGP